MYNMTFSHKIAIKGNCLKIIMMNIIHKLLANKANGGKFIIGQCAFHNAGETIDQFKWFTLILRRIDFYQVKILSLVLSICRTMMLLSEHYTSPTL